MHSLPVLTIVFNNAAWGAVSQAALQLYPKEHAARHAAAHGTSPLSSLEPMPDFEKYAEASAGYAERVTERDQLIPALQRALKVVRTERRQALLNVIGQG
jgi:acetolactate synthase-1/2/3 large subunit